MNGSHAELQFTRSKGIIRMILNQKYHLIFDLKLDSSTIYSSCVYLSFIKFRLRTCMVLLLLRICLGRLMLRILVESVFAVEQHLSFKLNQ